MTTTKKKQPLHKGTIIMKLSAEDKAKIQALAQAEDRSMTSIIRRALRDAGILEAH